MTMSNPADNPLGYPVAAPVYWEAGWRGVLPLPPRAKKNPPVVHCEKHRPKSRRSGTTDCADCVHYTGYAGVDPSFADVKAWGDAFPQGNLCLRVPDGVVGIDVDNYESKTGAAAFAEAVRRWGPLPATVRSTSREDGVSGIRLFRVPPGTLLEQWIVFPELGIGDIEIIQHHHRYVIAWPSYHPEGRPYWWLDDALEQTGIPDPQELPWLPQAWIDGLKITPRSLDLTGAAYDVKQALTEGAPTQVVQERLRTAIKELNQGGASRHDTCMRHVLAMLRLGKNGQPGVLQALGVLREVFVATVTWDGSRDKDEARSEFDRMITNDNAARELAQPGVTDWMRDMIRNAAGVDPKDEPPANERKPMSAGGSGLQSTRTLVDIEGGFWEARGCLNYIYVSALARMVSPWGVLGVVAARALTQVRPNWTLPSLIGHGSLNWFCAVVDKSGGGKTAAKTLARELLTGDVREKGIGSGEGIIGQFIKPATKDDPPEHHEANMFHADEVDQVAALRSRTGSTMMTILRSAFSGDTLGFSYVTKGRDVHLEAGEYRLTLVAGVQPGRAGAILDDEAGGTPQRFMWFPGNDHRVSRKHQSLWISSPIEMPKLELYPRTIDIPREAQELIVETRELAGRGELSPLDSHALFAREKFAFALALLDGRVTMSSEDWELSGVAAGVSDFTRRSMITGLAAAREMEAAERGRLNGIVLEASDTERAHQGRERVARIARWVYRQLEEHGGMTPSALNRAANARDRRWVETALEYLQSAGQVDFTGDKWILHS
jgi:hypothetical protein